MMKEKKESDGEEIGIVIGEANLQEASFIAAHPPQVGSYAILEYDGMRILAMVKAVSRLNQFLREDIESFESAKKIAEIEKSSEGMGSSVKGRLKLLGDAKTLEMPKTPPSPGTPIKKAGSETLDAIFGRGELNIGHLLAHDDVEVKLNANALLTRHLAILAITGAGKSNAVSVVVDGILKLNGMPIIFDMHSEYASAFSPSLVKRIEPKINPFHLSLEEFRVLVDIGKDAHVQERYLRRAYKIAREKMKEKGDFIEKILEVLEEIKQEEESELKTQSEKSAIIGALNKVDDFNLKYEGLVSAYAGDVISQLEQGKVNVVELGQVDEEYADVIVSHVLRKVLYRRKKKELPPAFFIMEEAHILAPASRSTLSKYWAERIAREGRKFGVGLCLVSQRPKNLDANSLSQANNAIIMKLVEPGDQKHVQQASERLSDDLLEQLPSLNTGEAVILGMCIPVPALVKIHAFKGKKEGTDANAVEEWKNLKNKKDEERSLRKGEAEDIYRVME